MDKIMGFLLPAHPTATPPGEVGVEAPKPPLHKPPAPASAPTSCALSTLCSGEFSHSLLGLGPRSLPHTNPGSKT